MDIYCPKCRESRVLSCEAIPYHWYNDRNDEILARPLEEEGVSWQKMISMTETHYQNSAEETVKVNDRITFSIIGYCK